MIGLFHFNHMPVCKWGYIVSVFSFSVTILKHIVKYLIVFVVRFITMNCGSIINGKIIKQ